MLDSGKYLGIYFGASWSQPCRKFNQILEACYKRLQRTGKPFEVILVSSDNDAAAFRAFYKKMPWLALPFSERRLKESKSDGEDFDSWLITTCESISF